MPCQEDAGYPDTDVSTGRPRRCNALGLWQLSDEPSPSAQWWEVEQCAAGQVVTLTLNLRLDTKNNEPGHVALADRQICNTFKTLGALPGPDGKLGTSDDT